MVKANRREFLCRAAAAGAVCSAAPAVLRSGPSANERIRVAVVGLGGRGRHSLCGALYQLAKEENVEIAGLSDCDQRRMEATAKEVEQQMGVRPRLEVDARRLLEDKNIHAILLATPNHWHALQTIWACQAGKDVYVEKPASHNVLEGRKMVEAARKYQRMVQVGTQCRSSPKIREGIAQLHQGVIGRVYMARGIAFKLRSGGKNAFGPVPEGLNWDLWLGPASEAPYNQLAITRWRFLKAYGNGELGDQGVHQVDMIRWGLRLQTHPTRIQSMGANNFRPASDEDTPGQQTMTALFAGKDEGRDMLVHFETRDGFTNDEAGMGIKYPFVDHRNVCGVIFFGTEGYMIIPDYSSYYTFLGPNRELGPHDSMPGAPMMDADHVRNWLRAIRSRRREDLTADIEQGHLSAAVCHLANIACTLQRTLPFDPAAEKFVGDPEADKLLSRQYRPPYLLPEQV